MSLIKTTFMLQDGRILSCEYSVCVSPASFHSPEEVDVSEPFYCMNGRPVELSDLPKGLEAIADKLYEANKGEYNYTAYADDSQDYDCEPESFDCEGFRYEYGLDSFC